MAWGIAESTHHPLGLEYYPWHLECLVKEWMQDTDPYPMCAFFQWPGSVFGARCPALGANPVPGSRSSTPGTRNRVLGIPLHHLVQISDAGTRHGSRVRYRVPGVGYVGFVPNTECRVPDSAPVLTGPRPIPRIQGSRTRNTGLTVWTHCPTATFPSPGGNPNFLTWRFSMHKSFML